MKFLDLEARILAKVNKKKEKNNNVKKSCRHTKKKISIIQEYFY